MRLSIKIFLPVIIAITFSFSFAGYMMIQTFFQSSIENEIQTAIDENKALRFSFETALQSVTKNERAATAAEINDICKGISGSVDNRREFALYSGENVLYSDTWRIATGFDAALFQAATQDTRSYKIHMQYGKHLIRTACVVQNGDEHLYLENGRDISKPYSDRENQMILFQRIMAVMLIFEGVIIFLITHFSTKPVRSLTRIAQKLADGDLSIRAEVYSKDEVGELAERFNHMADEIETRVSELEHVNVRQQDFIASFAHELKTPLTSMIGYADMLRTKKLNADDYFLAANYIYTEGKRLESLSLKLLELIVIGKQDFEFRRVNISELFKDIYHFLKPQFLSEGIKLKMRSDPAELELEPELFRTLLLNLLDNARKACPDQKGQVYLEGKTEREGYCIYVRDNGVGIAEKDLPRVTEAFYMADKSRSRQKGGVGLGLAICAEIINLHKGEIQFDSKLGKGTVIRLILKEKKNEAE